MKRGEGGSKTHYSLYYSLLNPSLLRRSTGFVMSIKIFLASFFGRRSGKRGDGKYIRWATLLLGIVHAECSCK